MCGIFGSGGFTPQVREMLPYLGLMMQSRGVDAWGASDGISMVHELGAFSHSWAARRDEILAWDQGIFHTRGASVGAGDDINCAHPFQEARKDGSYVIGIHNGCIRNWKEMNTKYKRQLPCDSMQLWRHLAEGLSWSELEGAAALAWYEVNPDGERRLLLAREDNPALHLAQVEDGGLVFASTIDSLELAARITGTRLVRTFAIHEHIIYHLCAEEAFKTDARVEFAKPAPAQSQSFYRGGRYFPFVHDGPRDEDRTVCSVATDNQCRRCGVTIADSHKLLCVGCHGTMITMWNAARKAASGEAPLAVAAASGDPWEDAMGWVQ